MTPKKHINIQFFKQWSSDMAYILGYIAADGNIHKRKNRINSWMLNITSKDKNHLVVLKNAMNSDHGISSKQNGQGDVSYQLIICHAEICKDLRRLGIHPRKTFTLKPIKVPKEFFSDFVRGYFDADGSVYIYVVNGTPQIKAHFTGASRIFIEKLGLILSQLLGIKEKPIYTTKAKGVRQNMYHFDFYIRDCQRLFDFMYTPMPSLYLSRKYEMFEKWKFVKRRHYIRQVA
ncbi:MAG: hypothetical protein M1429_00620 [Patescibacteria group bacterium]|nr:hypothetical protein [Patescibacteria group bacterium]